MINSIRINLQAVKINPNWTGLKFYLFGSALTSIKSNDIDLLIEYDSETLSIENALQLRTEIARKLYQVFRCTVDIILLNRNEHIQSQFIDHENGILLFSI